MGKVNRIKIDSSDRSSGRRSIRLGEGQLNSCRRRQDPTTYAQNPLTHSFQARKEEPNKFRSRHSEQRYKCKKEKMNSNALNPSRQTNKRRAGRKGRRAQPPKEHLNDDEFNPGSLAFDPRAENGRVARNGSDNIFES